MLLLQLTLLFVLVLGGKHIFLYHRAGDDVIIPCDGLDSSKTSCSMITWEQFTETYGYVFIVRDGKIEEDSPQAAKVSLDSRCSLTITNISSKDAGWYGCSYGDRVLTNVFLNILTLSADQSMDPEGGVTLMCTLWRNYRYFCEYGSLLLLDEEGAELERKDEDDTPETLCPSFLTITHQSNHSRQCTCQFVTDDGVKISANYTRVSTVDLTSDSTPNKIIFILNIAKMFLLIILVIIVTTVHIKYRRRTGAAEDQDEDCVPVRKKRRKRKKKDVFTSQRSSEEDSV